MQHEQNRPTVVLPDYQDPEPRRNRRRGEGLRAFFSTIFVVILAIGFAVLLTTYIFQSYQVDGPSMEPTLHHQDRLVIWKVPRTIERITGNIWVPERGKIIVFIEEEAMTPNGQPKQLIKRVIGVPGDRVVVSDGIVTVFNDENPNGFNPDVTLGYNNGQVFPINNNEEDEVIVGENEVFVLGDNRGNSMDSRYFGTVDAENIVGELALRIWPIDKARSF